MLFMYVCAALSEAFFCSLSFVFLTVKHEVVGYCLVSLDLIVGFSSFRKRLSYLLSLLLLIYIYIYIHISLPQFTAHLCTDNRVRKWAGVFLLSIMTTGYDIRVKELELKLRLT